MLYGQEPHLGGGGAHGQWVPGALHHTIPAYHHQHQQHTTTTIPRQSFLDFDKKVDFLLINIFKISTVLPVSVKIIGRVKSKDDN